MPCVALSSLTFCAVERKRNSKSINKELSFSPPAPAKSTKTNTDQNKKENTEERAYGLIPVPKHF